MPNGEKQKMCASFYTDAILKSGIAGAKKLMMRFPGAEQVTDGLTLKFLLKSSGQVSLIELKKESIVYTFYFDKESKRTRSTNLAQFFSILAYLRSAYDIRINALYAPVLEALSDSVLFTRERGQMDGKYAERMSELSRSNAVLSGELWRLSQKNMKLEEREKILRNFCLAVLESFSHSALSKTNAREALDRLGIKSDLSEELAKILADYIA